MPRNLRSRSKGITIVEVLLGVGLLALLASFAIPSIGGASTRMEMRAAAENIEYSIRTARNTARMTESEVWMNILTDAETSRQRITITVSEAGLKKLSQPEFQEFLLEDKLIISSDNESFEFDGKGIVRNPGRIILAARDDEIHTTNFVLE